MLKEGDIIRVHIISPVTGREIVTTCSGDTYEVKRRNGRLGIDWNTERRPYISGGEVFVPFCGFSSTVTFEDVATGGRYYYSNITGEVVEEQEVIQC